MTVANGMLFFLFSFLALPFVQAWAELGFLRLPAREFSARMNRNVTLLLLGALALMPVSLVLGFSIGGMHWGMVTGNEQFRLWNPFTPFGVFCLFGPLTFAGAIAWAQGAGSLGDGAALPFLRRTIGAISGWVALISGIGMAGIILTAAFAGETFFPAPRDGSFVMLVMVPAFFWTAMSLACREGVWEKKPRAFRLAMQACVLLFPLFVLWLLGGLLFHPPGEPLYASQAKDPVWNWPNLALGALFLASLGHGLTALRRRWPEKASAVNVAVHVCMMLTILICRLPFADPVKYEAAARAAYLAGQFSPSSSGVGAMERDFGRYGAPAFDQALAARGLTREEWQADREKQDKNTHDKTMAEHEALVRSVPVSPPGAVLPESAVRWMAGDGWQTASMVLYINKTPPGSNATERRIVIRDLNNDGRPDLILISPSRRASLVLTETGEGVWSVAGQVTIPRDVNLDGTVGQRSSQWDDLILGDTVLPFKLR